MMIQTMKLMIHSELILLIRHRLLSFYRPEKVSVMKHIEPEVDTSGIPIHYAR